MSLYTSKGEQCETRQINANDHVPPPPPPPEYRLPTIVAREDIGASRLEWSSAEIKSHLPIDILLISVKDHEFYSCYSYMKLRQVRRSWCDSVGMVDFGEFGEQKVRVALVRSKMGPVEASSVVRNAAQFLNPRVVIFVGYCATVNPAKAKLGDVVISAKLATYSSKKITADGTHVLRGVKADVSPKIARLILSAGEGWTPPLTNQNLSKNIKVHCQAVMLSGPELVDNLKRRQELLQHYPDAIGLEMEGEGLYAAAHDLGIQWAVIKGVSDLADGSKATTEEWRSFSSAMAASVVYNMFKFPDVIRQWPHYKRIEPAV